jgi:hypothetical protein
VLGAGIATLHVGQACGCGLYHGALVGGGKKPVGEVVEPTRRNQAPIDHHVAGQFFVFTPKTVGRPGSHARSPLQATASVQEVVGVGVFGKLAGHRSDHGEIVDMLPDMRKEVAHRNPALTRLLKLPGTRENRADVVELRGVDLKEITGVLARIGFQSWLGVKGVDLRHAPIHIEEDHALRALREMQGGHSWGDRGPRGVTHQER